MNTRKHPQSGEGKTILLKSVMISLSGYQHECMMSLKAFLIFLRINNNDLGYHSAFICHPDSTHSGQCLICVYHLESIYICIDSMFSNINHQCIDTLGAFVVATMMK